MLSIKHEKNYISILIKIIKKTYPWNKPVDTHKRKKMALSLDALKMKKNVGFVKVCRKMVRDLNVFFT